MRKAMSNLKFLCRSRKIRFVIVIGVLVLPFGLRPLFNAKTLWGAMKVALNDQGQADQALSNQATAVTSETPNATPGIGSARAQSEKYKADPLFLHLRELQARLSSLSAQYTPAHPDVIDLKQQITDIKTRLDEKYGSRPAVNSPARQETLASQEVRPSSVSAPRPTDSGIGPAESGETSAEEKAELIETARLLAVLLDSGRVVIGKAQPAINNPRLEDKGFSSAVFEGQIRKEFLARTGHDLRNLAPAQMPERAKSLLVRLAFFMQKAVQEAQSLINQKGIGFKGFIPATFATRVAEKFSKDTGLTLRQIGPPTVEPRNSNNKPDEQEKRALLVMQKSHPRVGDHIVEQQSGNRSVGVLLPLFYTKQCLGCHGTPKGTVDISGYEREGFKEGDIGGAISVMLPVDNRLLKAEANR
jgi:hypothetical protein